MQNISTIKTCLQHCYPQNNITSSEIIFVLTPLLLQWKHILKSPPIVILVPSITTTEAATHLIFVAPALAPSIDIDSSNHLEPNLAMGNNDAKKNVGETWQLGGRDCNVGWPSKQKQQMQQRRVDLPMQSRHCVGLAKQGEGGSHAARLLILDSGLICH